MKKRLLLTGFGGFVAGSVAWQARSGWEVHALSRRPHSVLPDGLQLDVFDLRETDRLKEVFDRLQPDAVIHTAALANIDYCQSHPEEAEAVHVIATREVARMCRKHRSKLVYCSTDTVFDGQKGMYTEEDKPEPVNVYGQTKVRGEEAVRNELERSVVARLSLVMGFPVMGAGNSFLAKMISALEGGEEVLFPENEIRTPIDVITLGASLLELAQNDFMGTIHLSGSTRLNRYEMALRIANQLGLPTALIRATDSNAIKGRAPRPNDASLDNALARRVLKTPMRTLDQGLDQVLLAKEKQDHESS